MMPVLDIHPTDTNFARECVRRWQFTFCVQADPTIQLSMFEGIAWIRKLICLPENIGIKTLELDNGDIINVPCVDIATFSRDVGVQQWGVVRVRPADVVLFRSWPGPIARRIIIDSETCPEYDPMIHEWYYWNNETPSVRFELELAR